MITISQKSLKLIKNLFILVWILGSCAYGFEHFQMKNTNGTIIELRLALTKAEHTQGLSGLKPQQFSDSQGLLFVNSEMGQRRFWMPDTYFNLDIIFLDKDLKIVGIEKNVPAHPGKHEPPTIYKTETYLAQFILETKAGSAFSKNLKINDQLKFIGLTSLSEIALKTRPRL